MNRSQSGPLGSTGNAIMGATGGGGETQSLPKVPGYLSVGGLTKRRKLPSSTGNLHAYLGEDYSQLNWPMPKMYGKEKYGYSLVDVETNGRAASQDHRFVKDIALMSKKLTRLAYDAQIVDNEWRNTYKLLLKAEHSQDTLPKNVSFTLPEAVQAKQGAALDKTKALMKNNVANYMKYLLELQTQKDMYAEAIKEEHAKCDGIKETIKNEAELDDLRQYMEGQTKEKVHHESPFWRTKFNIRSAHA